MHVLGAPPAFILSQDRTLRSNARRREPSYSVSGGPSSSKDPADLGFAEIDVSEQGSEIRISLVCLVDLSIAVSGSQGTPAQVAAGRLVAARGITIRAASARASVNPRLHVLHTSRARAATGRRPPGRRPRRGYRQDSFALYDNPIGPPSGAPTRPAASRPGSGGNPTRSPRRTAASRSRA